MADYVGLSYPKASCLCEEDKIENLLYDNVFCLKHAEKNGLRS